MISKNNIKHTLIYNKTSREHNLPILILLLVKKIQEMLTMMPASTAFNVLTVILNMLVRMQFFAMLLIATKCPTPLHVFKMSEMEYDDIGLRNLKSWFELECSHARNNSRQYVDLCRAMPTT